MIKRIDFIFDLETIGANVHICPIVDMAYTTFDWQRFSENPYSFEELTSTIKTAKLSIKDQIDNYGCSYNKSDIDWWASLPKEARKKLAPSENDLTVTAFCDSVIEYLRLTGKIEYWWSRGNTFDPVILWRHMNATGHRYNFNEYLKYARVRDIRTHIDAKFNYSTNNGFIPVADEEYWNKAFVAHDSTHDVAADILRLQAIFRAENDLEHINR